MIQEWVNPYIWKGLTILNKEKDLIFLRTRGHSPF